MSSPLNRIDPLVTSYAGLPSNVLASVDLPEPLGPISAWSSPAPTARSTPLRISTPSTATCRSTTSNSGGTPSSYYHYAGRGNTIPGDMAVGDGPGGGAAGPLSPCRLQS